MNRLKVLKTALSTIVMLAVVWIICFGSWLEGETTRSTLIAARIAGTAFFAFLILRIISLFGYLGGKFNGR
jgi:hypothetical protein